MDFQPAIAPSGMASFTVKDYITQREYTDQAYKPLIEHRFSHMDFSMVARKHLGWLKFRVGEVGRFKQPELPNMEQLMNVNNTHYRTV